MRQGHGGRSPGSDRPLGDEGKKSLIRDEATFFFLLFHIMWPPNIVITNVPTPTKMLSTTVHIVSDKSSPNWQDF